MVHGSVMNSCMNCGKPAKVRFCGRSCSASYNNRAKPKRKPEHKCIDCGKSITAKRARCREHYLIWTQEQVAKDMTLSEAIYTNHHRSSAYALVRSRARAAAKKLGLDSCEKCEYNKHIEIAHIKPVSSFSEETMLSEINHRDNIMALCPNCHWEFDHNL